MASMIYLNQEFYRRIAIEQALADFSEILDGKIVDDDFNVELHIKKEGMLYVELEFKNYVLGIMKNMVLV